MQSNNRRQGFVQGDANSQRGQRPGDGRNSWTQHRNNEWADDNNMQGNRFGQNYNDYDEENYDVGNFRGQGGEDEFNGRTSGPAGRVYGDSGMGNSGNFNPNQGRGNQQRSNHSYDMGRTEHHSNSNNRNSGLGDRNNQGNDRYWDRAGDRGRDMRENVDNLGNDRYGQEMGNRGNDWDGRSGSGGIGNSPNDYGSQGRRGNMRDKGNYGRGSSNDNDHDDYNIQGQRQANTSNAGDRTQRYGFGGRSFRGSAQGRSQQQGFAQAQAGNQNSSERTKGAGARNQSGSNDQ